MPKILIVEDDPLMARMYQKIFLFEKYEVEMAADGESALVQARSFNPTAVLLDVMMPKLNGFEVLQRMKSDPELASIPVIMLTNLASEKDAENAMLKGAVRYIVKSRYEPKEIVQMVEEIILAHSRDAIPVVQ